MNGTVNVLCYKSKTLANGEHPLMICISKEGERKYQSLGISINPQHWDFKKNQPKRNCPNRDKIKLLIDKEVRKYTDKIFDFKSTNKEFTLTTLVEK